MKLNNVFFLMILTGMFFTSCRDEEKIVREVEVNRVEEDASEVEEEEGILEQAGEEVDKEVNEEIDEEIEQIGDDNN